MGVSDKMWDALTTVIKMNDKVERLAETVKTQQAKIESLTERVVRLETALEIALSARQPGRKRIERMD
jgi:chaperonin cofactor prefoldin